MIRSLQKASSRSSMVPGSNKDEPIAAHEVQLVKRSDLVFIHSKTLKVWHIEAKS